MIRMVYQPPALRAVWRTFPIWMWPFVILALAAAITFGVLALYVGIHLFFAGIQWGGQWLLKLVG